MAHAIRHLIRGCLLLAIAVLGVRAQPAAPVLRFTVFSAKPVEGLSFVPRAGGPAQKIVFSSTARSPHYEYRGSSPLRFSDTTGAVVAEASVPPEIRDALLLFLPSTEKNFRYKIAVLDDAPSVRAPGSLSVINLSGLALSGSVGTGNVTLQPGLNPPLSLGSNGGKVALLSTQKGKPYPSYTGMVKLGRDERALLILFPPVYQGSFEVSSRLLIDAPGAAGKSGAPGRK